MNSHLLNIFQTAINLKLILNRNGAKSWLHFEQLNRPKIPEKNYDLRDSWLHIPRSTHTHPIADEGSKNLLLRINPKQNFGDYQKKKKKKKAKRQKNLGPQNRDMCFLTRKQ